MKHFDSCGFLIQSLDKYLLCHPSNLCSDTNNIDKSWGLPKGKLNSENEEKINCALRETFEETNINLLHFPNIKFSTLPIFTNSYLTQFQGERVSKTIFIFHANDIDGVLQRQTLSCPSLIENTKIPEMDNFRWVIKEEAKEICTHSLKDLFENLELYTKSPYLTGLIGYKGKESFTTPLILSDQIKELIT